MLTLDELKALSDRATTSAYSATQLESEIDEALGVLAGGDRLPADYLAVIADQTLAHIKRLEDSSEALTIQLASLESRFTSAQDYLDQLASEVKASAQNLLAGLTAQGNQPG